MLIFTRFGNRRGPQILNGRTDERTDGQNCHINTTRQAAHAR